MLTLIEAEVKVNIFNLSFFMYCQVLDWVSTDMVIEVKVSDTDTHHDIGYPIKVTLDEKV